MNQELYNQIQSYLNDEMTEKVKKSFEEKIVKNWELSSEVDIHKAIKRIFEDKEWPKFKLNEQEIKDYKDFYKKKETKNLSNTIQKIGNNYSNQKKRKSIFLYAAIFVGILLISSILLISKPTSEKLYATYINYEELPSAFSRGKTDPNLNKALDYFYNKDFKEATNTFKIYFSQTNENEINNTAYLYYAFSQIENDKYTEGLTALNYYAKNNELERDRISWYKALVLVKQNNKDEAIKILELLIQKNFRSEDAKKILKKIK